MAPFPGPFQRYSLVFFMIKVRVSKVYRRQCYLLTPPFFLSFLTSSSSSDDDEMMSELYFYYLKKFINKNNINDDERANILTIRCMHMMCHLPPQVNESSCFFTLSNPQSRNSRKTHTLSKNIVSFVCTGENLLFFITYKNSGPGENKFVCRV